ncbi:MAG TPA: hypothetical protein VFF24_04020 [Acidimicrobiia bacterium]|nr:hypothetical protein [Acidimicrobiia bacterium]
MTTIDDERNPTMADLLSELETVQAKVTAALQASEADNQASPVLVAVLREFAAKATKATGAPGRDAVIELEQAGDSAKAAAEADTGAGEPTRELVLDAHLAICMLKANGPT